MQVEGSPLYLTQKFGLGYRLNLSLEKYADREHIFNTLIAGGLDGQLPFQDELHHLRKDLTYVLLKFVHFVGAQIDLSKIIADDAPTEQRKAAENQILKESTSGMPLSCVPSDSLYVC